MISENLWTPRSTFESSPAVEGVPELIWKLLKVRGLGDEEKYQSHFQASLSEMRSPFLLNGMEKAVNRIIEAYKNKEKICIYADFDLDGSSGLALLLDALQRLGFEDVVYYQPKRLSEGYGVHCHAIDKLHEQSVSLIVTVDVGITAIEAVDHANSLGLDVIITDHHLPKEVLPNALTVVNPNTEECDSDLGHLCGAGVAFYLSLAIRNKMKDLGILQSDFNPKDLLDYFVIGTLTDMVPLKNENRSLVKHGLIQLKNTKRAGLKKLISKLGYEGRELSGQDVAIGIAPKLNALSRMEMGLLPIDIFLAEDELEAEGLIQQVLNLNSLRRTLQQEAEEDAEKKFLEKEQRNFAFVWSETYHKGVIGLVATRLTQNYGIPSFVGSVKDGKISGSCRAPDGYSIGLPDIMEAMKEYFLGFGGHAQAAGFQLKEENVDALYLAMTEFFSQPVAEKESSESISNSQELVYDVGAQLSELDKNFMKWLDKLGPFGQEFPVPNFLIENLDLVQIKELRGGHLKLNLRERSQKNGMDALFFSPPSHISSMLREGISVSVIAELQWNYFAGRKSLQLLVRDIKEV